MTIVPAVKWRTAMAYRSNPNDPFIAPPPTGDLDQLDRLDEGAASATRIALYAVAVLALVGALFYGMSSSTNDTASSTSGAPANNVAQRPATAAPAPARDATPRPNTQSGVTTGSAPAPADSPKQ
jgi:hypothetical protein